MTSDAYTESFVLRGTARPTGRPFEQHCIGVAHTDHDGRITRFDDYWNPLVAMRIAPSRSEPGLWTRS